jgi:CheY-like chemotaxis protein
MLVQILMTEKQDCYVFLARKTLKWLTELIKIAGGTCQPKEVSVLNNHQREVVQILAKKKYLSAGKWFTVWVDPATIKNQTITPDYPQPKAAASSVTERQFRIIHVDDEDFVLDIVSSVIARQFKNVTVDRLQNGDEAWNTLSRQNPDLLITDLLNDNVPGRKGDIKTSGFHLIARLAERNVKYPVLIVSGSLSNVIQVDHADSKMEDYVKLLFGSRLSLSFLKKPFTTEQLVAALSKHITTDRCINT